MWGLFIQIIFGFFVLCILWSDDENDANSKIDIGEIENRKSITNEDKISYSWVQYSIDHVSPDTCKK